MAFTDQFPVYFRADLLRAIVIDHLLTTKENTFAVYSDLDVTPLPCNKLFDKKTVC